PLSQAAAFGTLERYVESDGDKDEQESEEEGLILRPPEMAPPPIRNAVLHTQNLVAAGDWFNRLVGSRSSSALHSRPSKWAASGIILTLSPGGQIEMTGGPLTPVHLSLYRITLTLLSSSPGCLFSDFYQIMA